MVFCLVQILSIIVLSKEESDIDLDKLSLTPYWFLTSSCKKKVKHLLLIHYVITHFVTQFVKETDFSICVLNVKAANDLPHKFILMNTIAGNTLQ